MQNSPACRDSETVVDRIDLSDTNSCRYWAGQFEVSWQELCEAVARAGDRAPDVEHHLREQGLGKTIKLETTSLPADLDRPAP